MICAICLQLGRPLTDDLDGDWARPAITIANGTALCPEHLGAVDDWETADGAAPSLKGLRAIIDQAGPHEDPAAEDGPPRTR